jgi:hypothetical protein
MKFESVACCNKAFLEGDCMCDGAIVKSLRKTNMFFGFLEDIMNIKMLLRHKSMQKFDSTKSANRESGHRRIRPSKIPAISRVLLHLLCLLSHHYIINVGEWVIKIDLNSCSPSLPLWWFLSLVEHLMACLLWQQLMDSVP